MPALECMAMITRTRGSGRRGRGVVVVLVSLGVSWGLTAACSNTSTAPPELSTQRDSSSAPDRTAEQETGAGPIPEAGGGGHGDSAAEAEVGCQAAGDAGATVSMTSMSFGDGGLVGCGTQAQSQTVSITNETCAAFTFASVLTSGASYYAITPAQGTVPPLSSQTVTVNPAPIPQISAVTPDLYEGTLSITTTAPGDSGHIVQLHMTAYGAVLTSTVFGQSLAFGGVAIGETGSAQFSVNNNGNAATTVSFAVGSQYFRVETADGGAPSFAIAANQSIAPQVTFSPTAVQPYTDAINTTVLAGTPLCATPPAITLLTGQGTTGVSVQPTNLAFGLVQCGQPAAAYQTITISNTGAAITYTPTFVLGGNSPYTLAQDASGTPITPGTPIPLAAGPASTTIRVVPKTISNPATTLSDGYQDTLIITTTGSGDAPHNISLHETAQGAILALSPTSVATSQGDGLSTFVGFSVANTGNYPAGYALASATTQGPDGTFTSNLTGGTLGPSTGQQGILTCIGPPGAPPPPIQYLGTLTLTPNAGTILCADSPPPMPLSITN
jgi:hypothetical protein